jgi:hypothetical protein
VRRWGSFVPKMSSHGACRRHIEEQRRLRPGCAIGGGDQATSWGRRLGVRPSEVAAGASRPAGHGPAAWGIQASGAGPATGTCMPAGQGQGRCRPWLRGGGRRHRPRSRCGASGTLVVIGGS